MWSVLTVSTSNVQRLVPQQEGFLRSTSLGNVGMTGSEETIDDLKLVEDCTWGCLLTFTVRGSAC